jgi:hypothetical protein
MSQIGPSVRKISTGNFCVTVVPLKRMTWADEATVMNAVLAAMNVNKVFIGRVPNESVKVFVSAE